MPMRCLRCGADQSWIEGNRRADENERVEKAEARVAELDAALRDVYSMVGIAMHTGRDKTRILKQIAGAIGPIPSADPKEPT